MTIVQLHYRKTEDEIRTKALRSLRSTLDWLGDDVHYIANEVDPIVEMCTITKAFDNSKALVANKIKGYPGVRMISNLYSTKARTAKLHGMEDFRDIKLKILDCIQNPIAPKIVSEAEAPCQELFIPKKDIRNIDDLIPIAQHTYTDGARIFGAGTHFFYGEPWVPRGGSQLSMYRMGFREGQTYASINMVPGGGGDVICSAPPQGHADPVHGEHLPAGGCRARLGVDAQSGDLPLQHRQDRAGRRAPGRAHRARQGQDRRCLRDRPVRMGARRLRHRRPAGLGDRRGRAARQAGRGAAASRMGAGDGPRLPHAAGIRADGDHAAAGQPDRLYPPFRRLLVRGAVHVRRRLRNVRAHRARLRHRRRIMAGAHALGRAGDPSEEDQAQRRRAATQHSRRRDGRVPRPAAVRGGG